MGKSLLKGYTIVSTRFNDGWCFEVHGKNDYYDYKTYKTSKEALNAGRDYVLTLQTKKETKQ